MKSTFAGTAFLQCTKVGPYAASGEFAAQRGTVFIEARHAPVGHVAPAAPGRHRHRNRAAFGRRLEQRQRRMAREILERVEIAEGDTCRLEARRHGCPRLTLESG